jgi:hypothetical protein
MNLFAMLQLLLKNIFVNFSQSRALSQLATISIIQNQTMEFNNIFVKIVQSNFLSQQDRENRPQTHLDEVVC